MKKLFSRLILITISFTILVSFYGCHKKEDEPASDPVIIIDDDDNTNNDPEPIQPTQNPSRISYSHQNTPLPYGDNETVWIDDNDYYQYGYFGQCTWFAYGIFYGYYGYKTVDLTCMADSFAQTICETYPKKFKASNKPTEGKDMCIVFSCSDDWGHTGVITDFDGTNITYIDGNIMQLVKQSELLNDDAICEYDGEDVYILARNTTYIHIGEEIANWRTVTTTYQKFCDKFPHTQFANPR